MDGTDIRDWVGIALSIIGMGLIIPSVVLLVRHFRRQAGRRRMPIRNQFPPSQKERKARLRRALEFGVDAINETELHDLRVDATNFAAQRLIFLPLAAQCCFQLGRFVQEPSFWQGFFITAFTLFCIAFFVFSGPSTRLGKDFLQRHPWPTDA